MFSTPEMGTPVENYHSELVAQIGLNAAWGLPLVTYNYMETLLNTKISFISILKGIKRKGPEFSLEWLGTVEWNSHILQRERSLHLWVMARKIGSTRYLGKKSYYVSLYVIRPIS
jgi:hypothetical protein